MYQTDCLQNFVGSRKKSFLTGRLTNFAQKSNSTGWKSFKWRWNSLKTFWNVERTLEIVFRLSNCTWSDTFGFGQECHQVLFFQFSRKYTIHLDTREHLFNDLQKNGDHQQNHKEIFNKPCGTEKQLSISYESSRRKNAKRPLTDVPHAYVCIHPSSLRVNSIPSEFADWTQASFTASSHTRSISPYNSYLGLPFCTYKMSKIVEERVHAKIVPWCKIKESLTDSG